jgi:Domain of unknown function (DUF4403)
MNRPLLIPFAAAFLALACSTQPQPAAAPTPAAVSTPAELSSIVIPIHTSLAPLLPILEAQVPKGVSRLDGYELDPRQRFGMKYKVVRDPIVLNMLGSGVHATVNVHYALEGCNRTKNPVSGQYAMWPCISCGFNEPMRLATIELQSRFDWGSDWTLRSLTTARPVAFSNRCAVTFFNIDITDWKLAPLLNEQLRDVAKTIDQNTPKLTSIRPAAQKIWSSLQAPAEIAPNTWLVLEPFDVALTPIHGTGLSVESALTLHARTRVVVGNRPVTTTRPLPPLRSMQPNGNGIRVPFDLEIPYAESGRLLTQQFGGRTYKTAGGTIAVDSIRLSPGHNGRLNVEASIDFRGGGLKRYRGLVHLDGLPVFDSSKASITIPDLSYRLDAKRHNPFLRTFDRLAHDEVELRLRSGAVWSIADQLTGVRGEIERGITRQLSPGVFLRGRVDSIQAVSIVLGADAISIHIVATGAAEVDVRDFRVQ